VLKSDATPGADESYRYREVGLSLSLNKRAQSCLSTDNDSVMSDDGKSDE
jgi:hypothetical protein